MLEFGTENTEINQYSNLAPFVISIEDNPDNQLCVVIALPKPINSKPNFWLSCILIDDEAMCQSVRGEKEELFLSETGKSCPAEILRALSSINAEGRPIWKPMHAQPIYRNNPFITRYGNGRAVTNAYITSQERGVDGLPLDVGMDIFNRGLCLPSDNKMTEEQQNRIIDTIIACFD